MLPSALRPGRLVPALALGCLAALGSPDRASAQQHLALLSQFRGDVKVARSTDGGELPARVGLRLAEGDRLEVPRGSRAVLLFNNGRLVTATTPLVVAPVGGAGANEVYERAARTLAAAERQTLPEVKSGVGRPPPAVAYPLAPSAGTAVPGGRPTFAWQPQEGIQEYLVQIRPAAGGTPLRFRVTGAGPWALPDTVPPLARGSEFLWTVVALPGGRIAGEERFRVLDDAETAAVDAFHASLEEAGVDASGDGLLLAAIFYADVGMLHEAAAALDRLMADTSPDERDPVVDLLQAQVLEALGRAEEARAAFERATRGHGHGNDDGGEPER